MGEGNPAAKCWQGAYNENPTFNNALRPYVGNKNPLPIPSTQVINSYNGIMLYFGTEQTLDGVSYPYFLWYVVGGVGAKCPVGPVVSGGYPTHTSAIPASGYSSALTNGSMCWIKMPDPTSI